MRSPVSRLLNASIYQVTPCRYRLWSACERPVSDSSLFHKNDWKGFASCHTVYPSLYLAALPCYPRAFRNSGRSLPGQNKDEALGA